MWLLEQVEISQKEGVCVKMGYDRYIWGLARPLPPSVTAPTRVTNQILNLETFSYQRLFTDRKKTFPIESYGSRKFAYTKIGEHWRHPIIDQKV